MINKYFDTYFEVLDVTIDLFRYEDSITVVCDLSDALKIKESISGYEFEEVIVETDSNEDYYYVSKRGNEFFCIEPVRRDKGILYTENDVVLVMDYISEECVDIYDYIEADELYTLIVRDGFDENIECDCELCCDPINLFDMSEMIDSLMDRLPCLDCFTEEFEDIVRFVYLSGLEDASNLNKQ